eukprot:scpid98788/ scgid12941/ 
MPDWVLPLETRDVACKLQTAFCQSRVECSYTYTNGLAHAPPGPNAIKQDRLSLSHRWPCAIIGCVCQAQPVKFVESNLQRFPGTAAQQQCNHVYTVNKTKVLSRVKH